MPRPEPSSSDLISRLKALLWLVTIPAIAVIALLSFSRPPETFTADVVESSVEPTDAGWVVADVRWTDEEGVRWMMSVELAPELVASGSVTLAADPVGGVSVIDPSEGRGPPGAVVVITALIGLAFAVVVLATARGFGYVRGTGRYGEMTPDEVKESHGFYWRH